MTNHEQGPPPRPPAVLVPEGAHTGGPAADGLRRLAVHAGGPVWVAQMKAEMGVGQPDRLGDVVWMPTDDGRAITLVNERTRASWVRDEPGRWRLRGWTPVTVAARIGVLLRKLDDQVDAVAALLRQDIRPWRELLEQGAQAAIDMGGNRSWVRFGERKVAELMYVTEGQAHRVVLVVDDVQALAGSWYADAAAAVDPVWGEHCRREARQAEAGEFPVGTYADRATAVLEAVKLRDGQRPGQSWRVEPVPGGHR